MARINMTRYAILGVLNLYPASGYDIKRFCDAGVTHFWNENYGHLYPVLHKLEHEKLIEQVKKTEIPAGQVTGRNRVVYQITERGRSDLKQWLTAPVQPAPPRLELLLKMTFAGAAEQDFLQDELQRLRQGHQARRVMMRKALAKLENDLKAKEWPGYPYWIATIRYGLQDADFRIRWYAETGARIQSWFSRNEAAEQVPAAYPTTGQDWINRIADDGSSWSVLQAGLQLDKPLDMGQLRLATRQLLDDEPVLRCRFDDACEPPVWRPLDLPDECWCALVISRTPQDTIRRLVAEPLPDSGQSWQVLVIRPHDTAGSAADYLLIRVHHALMDAAGLRDLAVLLAGRYRQQLEHEPAELPKLASRSMLPLFAAVGSPDPRRLFRPDLAALQAGWGLPGEAIPGPQVRPVHTVRVLSDQQSAGWLQAAKTAGVTVTTLLLAGLGQVLEEWLEPERDAVRLIQVTSNLRRYLPSDQALILGNLSGMLPIRFAAGQQAACLPWSQEQLQQLGHQLKDLQEQRADLHAAALLHLLSQRPYGEVQNSLAAAWQKARASQHAAPVLSKVGRWPDQALAFGDSAVCHVAFYGPAMHAPALLLAVHSYRGRISLSVGHFPDERPAGTMDRLLDRLLLIMDQQAKIG
jgi:DNA-binding PadR family transcriptional regulator/NRPS condensation-like uncharacterized protein